MATKNPTFRVIGVVLATIAGLGTLAGVVIWLYSTFATKEAVAETSKQYEIQIDANEKENSRLHDDAKKRSTEAFERLTKSLDTIKQGIRGVEGTVTEIRLEQREQQTEMKNLKEEVKRATRARHRDR